MREEKALLHLECDLRHELKRELAKARETWINLGNALLENGRVSDDYLEVQHVYMLAQMFHEHVFSLPHQPWDPRNQAFPSMSWPLWVGAFDWVARGISEALITYVGGVAWVQTLSAHSLSRTRVSHAVKGRTGSQ